MYVSSCIYATVPAGSVTQQGKTNHRAVGIELSGNSHRKERKEGIMKRQSIIELYGIFQADSLCYGVSCHHIVVIQEASVCKAINSCQEKYIHAGAHNCCTYFTPPFLCDIVTAWQKRRAVYLYIVLFQKYVPLASQGSGRRKLENDAAMLANGIAQVKELAQLLQILMRG